MSQRNPHSNKSALHVVAPAAPATRFWDFKPITPERAVELTRAILYHLSYEEDVNLFIELISGFGLSTDQVGDNYEYHYERAIDCITLAYSRTLDFDRAIADHVLRLGAAVEHKTTETAAKKGMAQ